MAASAQHDPHHDPTSHHAGLPVTGHATAQANGPATKSFVVGVFTDDERTLEAVDHVRGQGVKIYEVYSPYPIHGIDPKLGYKHSRLHIAAFMFGMTGTILALTMITYMNRIDWPMNVGGKPYVSPTLIPVTFEATVLLSALGMVATFLIASKLGPGAQKVIFDPRTTDDRFVMALEVDKNASRSPEQLMEVVRESGADEVYVKEVVL